MAMPLCTQATAAILAFQYSGSQLLAGDGRLQVPRRFTQAVCHQLSQWESLFPCVCVHVLSVVICFPQQWVLLESLICSNSKGSFLKLRAYYFLKTEIISHAENLGQTLYMNLGEVTYFWDNAHHLFKLGI